MAKKTVTPKTTALNNSAKLDELAPEIADATNQPMTTNHGVKINDDQNSLKSGERGSTLLEDFILREKITHFDHERIPERIVHAVSAEQGHRRDGRIRFRQNNYPAADRWLDCTKCRADKFARRTCRGA